MSVSSHLPLLLPASLDVKQGPWRGRARSGVIILQCFPGNNGVPGSKDRTHGAEEAGMAMGGAGETHRLMARLGDISMAALAEGPGVSGPGVKGETGHPPRLGLLRTMGFTAT